MKGKEVARSFRKG